MAALLFFAKSMPTTPTLAQRLQPPSAEHPFGTDTVGRDILARTVYGGQISLMIGLAALSGRGRRRRAGRRRRRLLWRLDRQHPDAFHRGHV